MVAHTSIQMTSIEDFRLIIWTITEIISDLIWASDFFGSREIWSLRYLVPKTFWSPHENHYMTFSGRSQTSWGLNFLGPNFSVTSKFRGKMRWGTILVIAITWHGSTLKCVLCTHDLLNVHVYRSY